MTSFPLFPHRLADQESVVLDPWWIERDGVRKSLTSPLKSWDYAREEKIGIVLKSLDEELFLRSTGLHDIADVELVLLADCKESQRRLCATHRLDSASLTNASFDLLLPRGELAEAMNVKVLLRLARQLSPRGDRIAFNRGARLFTSNVTRIVLEGDDPRFPTDPVAFSSLHLPNAPWTLRINCDGLDSSFMGAVRMLVNTEHPVGRMLLNNGTAAKIAPLAMADAIRLLVAYLADQSESLDSVEAEEGSVIQVVDQMCDNFLGSSLKSAIELYEHDPFHFDRLLHDRLNPLAGLVP